MERCLDAAFERFATMCADIGLPAWRVDPLRRDWRAPKNETLQTFASDPAVMDAVASAAHTLETDERSYFLLDLPQHAKLVLIHEQVRRHRYGWVATVVPTPGSGPALAALATGSKLNPADIETAILQRLGNEGGNPDGLGRLLHAAHGLAVEAAADEHAIQEFTAQLTLSYETNVMMSRIGQSMGKLEHAEVFIRDAVDEIAATLPFGWVVFVRWGDDELARAGVPEVISSFDRKRFDDTTIENAAHKLAATYHELRDTMIEREPVGIPSELGPEVIIQPIHSAELPPSILALGARRGEEWAVSSYDTLPVRTIAASIAAFLEILLGYQRQQDAFIGTLKGLSKALDAKDAYTRGHSERVALLAQSLAQSLGMDSRDVRLVHIAGLVHDIGKIGVAESILRGKGKLTDEEFAQIRLHPVVGNEILTGIPGLNDALPGVLHHHERWDGRGYPYGLRGEEIPRIARILGIVDAFDAMSSNRSYQTGQDRSEIFREIEACSGSHFDPELVQHFLKLDFSEYDRMLADEAQASDSRSRDRAA